MSSPTSYTLWFMTYILDKILKLKVTMARSKVKSRSLHYIAHLQPLTNVPTTGFQDSPDRNYMLNVTTVWSKVKSRSLPLPSPPNQCPYQVSTSCTLWFLRHSPENILKLNITTAKSKVNQGDTMTLHTYTPQPMSLPSINILHLRVSEKQPSQTFTHTLPNTLPSGHYE